MQKVKWKKKISRFSLENQREQEVNGCDLLSRYLP